MTTRFYADLPVFDDFAAITDFAAYAPVPDDWLVILSDVTGSTGAIAQGRYKDVNMAGAATITAVLNACKPVDIPFVFGGDGGTMVVPGELREVCTAALCGLKTLSNQVFNLDLRVGIVPVGRLRAAGHDVLIRKYRLSEGNFLAMFAGGGLARADDLLKGEVSRSEPVELECTGRSDEVDLSGLSCRWQPLVPVNGRILTLMIKAMPNRDEQNLLDQTLSGLETILSGGTAAPVKNTTLKFRWPPRGLKAEAFLTAGDDGYRRRLWQVMVQSAVQFLSDRTNIRAGSYHPRAYRREISTNTDFRKFDGILRMVLDVNETQLTAIEALLEDQFARGNLVYGHHVASTALMTCLLFSLERSEHVHFIDGSDGGFALAAKAFKERLKPKALGFERLCEHKVP